MAITPRIVLVDDIKTNLKIYRHALLGENYTFFSYSDSQEALKNIEKVQPHLLILDIEMPKLNGIELLNEIRNVMGFKNVPAIFITTLSDESKLKEAFESGANDILAKDFQPYQLKFKVKTLLEQYFLKQKLMVFGRQMKEKSQENENLIRILCHDLLNPLTAIKLLAMRNKDEKLLKINDTAVEIIEHVREMMALEAGKKEIKLGAVSLTEVIKKCVHVMEAKLESKKINYFFDNGFLNEVFVQAEQTSLANQVINNILSNAIKFSHEGGHIYFSLAVRDNQVFVTIRDEGIGVPESMVPDLFNKYVKTTRLGTSKEKGTGFGLPLVKTYMNLYGGDIFVETWEESQNLGKTGTAFTLVFNLHDLKAKEE